MKLAVCWNSKTFLKENIFSGKTNNLESNVDIKRIELR